MEYDVIVDEYKLHLPLMLNIRRLRKLDYVTSIITSLWLTKKRKIHWILIAGLFMLHIFNHYKIDRRSV